MSVFSMDFNLLVRERSVVDARHDRRAQVLRALDAMKWRVRLQRDAADMRIQFFQSPRGPDKSSRRTHHRDEVSNAAFGLSPDFVGSGLIMRTPIRVVGILVGIKVKIGMLL